jgi:hypothetical protein
MNYWKPYQNIRIFLKKSVVQNRAEPKFSTMLNCNLLFYYFIVEHNWQKNN